MLPDKRIPGKTGLQHFSSNSRKKIKHGEKNELFSTILSTSS